MKSWRIFLKWSKQVTQLWNAVLWIKYFRAHWKVAEIALSLKSGTLTNKTCQHFSLQLSNHNIRSRGKLNAKRLINIIVDKSPVFDQQFELRKQHSTYCISPPNSRWKVKKKRATGDRCSWMSATHSIKSGIRNYFKNKKRLVWTRD